jgi:hypothetical protein
VLEIEDDYIVMTWLNCMWNLRNSYRNLAKNMKAKDYLGELRADGK